MKIQSCCVWKGSGPRFPTHHQPYRYHTHSLLNQHSNTHSIHKKHVFCYYSKIQKIIRKPLSCDYFFIFLRYSGTCEIDGAKKNFHRLTHIRSIRSQWYFFHHIFSYVRIIHRNPWNPCFQCRDETFVLGLFSISIQRSCFGVSSYPSIFKTQLKMLFAPNFSQLVRRRHLKMGTWGKRTRKGSFQFKPSEKLCST